MWAWLLQRISAVAIVFFLILHMFFTYKPFVQLMLLMFVAFHGALGLRVILLDCNLVNIKHQKDLIWWLVGGSSAISLLVWLITY